MVARTALATFLLFAAACPPPERQAIDPAKIREAVADVRARAAKADTAWRRGLQEQIAAPSPLGRARCPVELPAPPPAGALANPPEETSPGAEVEAALDRFVVVRREGLADPNVSAPIVERVLRQLSGEQSLMSRPSPFDEEEQFQRWQALEDLKDAVVDDLSRPDMTFVADELVYPTADAPGRARGRAYVWDHRTRTIVCAADLGIERPAAPRLVAELAGAPLSTRPDVAKSMRVAFDLEILRALLPRLVRTPPPG